MSKFRKKPVVIEAMQLQSEQFYKICDWIGEDNLGDGTSRSECCIDIKTLEGAMSAHSGDFIICGVKGEFYPCKPDIFAATYEPV
jgi:hypothetical protein